MNDATSTTRYVRNERIITQEAGGATVLLTLDEGRYYSLDGVGSRAWSLCDGHHTVSEIAALLEREFDATSSEIEHDLLELFASLSDEKLVVHNPEKS
jgi:hypothetical protein